MSRPSLDSSRPILAPSGNKRFSTLTASTTSQPSHLAPSNVPTGNKANRFSTYSTAPSLTPSAMTSSSTDSRTQDLKEMADGFDRLEQRKLQQQRFVPSQEKSENWAKLALGAKVERALGRRMSSQDAVWRGLKSARTPQVHTEKEGLKA